MYHRFQISPSSDTRIPSRGFTLIELLVVVAIISLLVSILLPSLSKAKDLAKETVCLTHARQIGLGFEYYADQYNDYFPMPITLWNVTSGGTYRPWPCYLAPYIGGYPGEKSDWVAHGGMVKKDWIGTVLICPVWPYEESFVKPADLGYGMNVCLSPDASYAAYPPRQFRRSEFTKTSDRFVIGDATEWALNRRTDLPDWYYGESQINSGKERHRQGGNYLFIDGHADWMSIERIPSEYVDHSPPF